MIIRAATGLKRVTQARVFEDPGNRVLSLKAVQQVATMLSDQQLVTGVAILIIGYVKHCMITQYHTNIITTLAWMSHATHDTTILFTLKYLHENRIRRLWRGVYIFALYVMVLTMQVLTYHQDFLQSWGLSTQCIWNSLSNYGLLTPSLSITIYLMTTDFLETMKLLFPGTFGWQDSLEYAFAILLRSPSHLCRIARTARAKYRGNIIGRGFWSLVYLMNFGLVVLFLTVSEILFSNTFILCRLYVVLLLGNLQLWDAKAGAIDHGMTGSEDLWGFGQLLQMALLTLPLLAMLEIYIGDGLMPSNQNETVTNGEHADEISDSTLAAKEDATSSASSDKSSDPVAELKDMEARGKTFNLQGELPSLTTAQSVWGKLKAEFVRQGVDGELEDALYQNRAFRIWLWLTLVGVFYGTTYASFQGYII